MSTPHPQSDPPADARPGVLRRLRVGRPVDGPAAAARARRRSKQRRRIGNAAGLMAALVLTGVLYSAFAPANAADEGQENSSSAVEAGRELYEVSCITCHGENLEGVPNRGPSLIGVGEASVYFQVHTGRMPLARQEAQGPDKPVIFSDQEIDQLMAYVQSNGGGPTVPSGDLRDGDLAEGGELFRLNCASCHNFVGEAAALLGPTTGAGTPGGVAGAGVPFGERGLGVRVRGGHRFPSGSGRSWRTARPTRRRRSASSRRPRSQRSPGPA